MFRINHSVIFSIPVRITPDLEPVPGTQDLRMDIRPTRGQFTTAGTPAVMFLGKFWDESLEKTWKRLQ